ncbi:MAG: DUF6134 family protein [Woeseiaceae bacterium]
MSTQKIALLTALIIMAGAMPAANASREQANERRWQFDVLLDDKPIGVHTFAVEDTGTELRLETTASFDVKFLFINAFRYRHQNTEVWQDGCLSSIDAVTDSNGKELVVRGRRDGGDFDIAQADSTKTLPGCVQTFAYWNPAVLESEQLLNSQTGEYEAVAVTYEGPDQVSLAGQAVEALRYTLATRGGDITLWYSRDGLTWLALKAPAKGGRTLTYRPTRVPLDERDASLLARRD